MNLTSPLSDEEYEDLNDFLMSDATGEDSMDISMLDGFLTAIVSGPKMIPPSQWLPLVWGQDSMRWKTPAQAEHYLSMIMRQMNTIIDVLQNDPEEFVALTYTREDNGQTIDIIDDWCAGYVMGMNLDREAWENLLNSPDDCSLLTTILLYGTEVGAQQQIDDPSLADKHTEFVTMLNESIPAIYEYWAATRKDAAKQKTVRHKQEPAGRNDPCPCGSGKKFKKCCGGSPTLH